MSWPPHITVAVIVEEDGRFLVVEERIDGTLVVNQPAGHLEPGETLFEAARREALEETGWEVELTGISGIYQYDSGETLYHRVTFAAAAVHHTDRPLDPDIDRACWMSPAELASATLRSPLVLRSIEDFRARKPVPLDFIAHVVPTSSP
ncbi:MAG: NUDIX hydrolase [Pseudomonadales bacterium]|nr:NUDIX hydrolase [Pseudomonadales bacterium]